MNLWVLIAMVAVVALLVFGKNPVREFQNEQKEMMKKYGDDEITVRTNMYIEKKQNEASGDSMFGSSLGGSVGGNKKSTAPDANDMKASITQSATESATDPLLTKGISIAPASSDFETDNFGDIIIEQTTGVNLNSANTGESKPKPAYYPPIVNPAVKGKNSEKLVQLTGKEVKLRSGQPLLFEGIYIYTVNERGEKAIMPDGDYVLENGSKLSVSGGYQVNRE